jgi:hypothetical protein
MFKVGEWLIGLIICLLNVLKNDRGVDEAIFESVERPCELIYCILGIEKREVDEVAFHVLSRRMALRIQFVF